MKTVPFYIETTFGCGIRFAKSLEQAKEKLLKEVGSYGYKSVREATAKDIAWVKAMGGYTEE